VSAWIEGAGRPWGVDMQGMLWGFSLMSRWNSAGRDDIRKERDSQWEASMLRAGFSSGRLGL
jgi:hypothetical protein